MVNVNTVYQTVLYVLNKEQRGYIPPDEFNSLAELVQEEIFQSYFPDGSQLNRQNQNNTQNDTEFFNIFKNLSYKLYPFEQDVEFSYDSTYDCWFYTEDSTYSIQPIYLLGEIISFYSEDVTNTTPAASVSPSVSSITQLVSKKDYEKIIRSKLTAPTQQFPICYQYSSQATTDVSLKVFPRPKTLNVNCILSPAAPRWSFQTGGLGQYIYNPSTSFNFTLDISEQNNLIIGILKYAGVVINDPTIIEVASQEAQKTSVNEKS
mgnify:FL=1